MNAAARIRGMRLPPFDTLNARAAELRAAGAPVISLGQALPPYGPPPSVLAACRRAIDDADVHVYSADAGRASLRSALAARLAESFAVSVTPDEILITAGANQAFMLAAITLLEHGDEVLLPGPYFVNHDMAIAAAGAVPREIRVRDDAAFQVRWSDIEPQLTPRTRAIVLCNPSNPTGSVIDAAEGLRIVSELAARGVTVVSDETYMHFVYEGTHWSAASLPDWRSNVVVVGSFSKSFGMTGWRVGYVIAPAATCAELLKVQDAMVICAPVISQVAAEQAVRTEWDYPLAFHSALKRRRQLLHDALGGIHAWEWKPTPAGFFAFVRTGHVTDSYLLATRILDEAHVITIPGAAFGSAGEGCLRLSFGAVGDEELLIALARLRAFISHLP